MVYKITTNPQDRIDSSFDIILLTAPSSIAYKLLPIIHNTNPKPQPSIPHLHAQILILETKEPILEDIYWLNINNRHFPFLAAVAHTNFIDKKHYGGHHITYFGNYLPDNHPYLKMSKVQVLKLFLPYIQQLKSSHNTKFIIHNTELFTAPFAQPVHELHYSSRASKLDTGIPGIYLANMDSIYPWDRGLNYAVELGKQSVRHILP